MMSNKVEVCLTADIEFKINGAFAYPDRNQPVGADSVFRPANGVSEGLAALLAPLRDYGLPSTMFVETLQRIHFGPGPMREVVSRIEAVPGADIQLHVHPCWLNFRHADWRSRVKQGATHDQMAGRGVDAAAILQEAVDNFVEIVGRRPLALRTGNLSVDMDVYAAQMKLGIPLASSVGFALEPSPDPELHLHGGLARRCGVVEVPVTSFKTWSRREKLLTLEGNSFRQLLWVLDRCHAQQSGPVVILTHASEMAASIGDGMPPRYKALPANQKRWRSLCQYLANNADRFVVRSFSEAWEDWQRSCERPVAAMQASLGAELSHWLSWVGMAR